MCKGTAALVHFYYGEELRVNRLAQETVPTWRALEGYERKVLLRHETDIGKGRGCIELSEKAEKMADEVLLPTAENFVNELNGLGAEGYVVDVYIFSHGLNGLFLASKGTYGDNVALTGDYIERHVSPLKLRLVWGTNCYGASLLPTWKRLGARAATGSRYVNFYPTRFGAFAKRWQRGLPLGQCLTESARVTPRFPVHAYILGDAIGRLKQWDGNVVQATRVLGKNKHAKRYFESRWLDPGEWRDGLGGRANMNYSSHVMSSRSARSVTINDTW